jgi:DNA topoisomerase-2
MANKTITDFLTDEYVQFAAYDTRRKIASQVDGLKISARKVVHTVIKQNINQPKKVSQLASKVAEETQYLHGEASLGGVIVGQAQDFTGTNNINLLKPEGNFGNRAIPAAAATRYIFTCKTNIIDVLFRKEDRELVPRQVFEGDVIEPRFFMPTIPLLLVNGSDAVATGFAQKILPRNPEQIIKYLKSHLAGKKPRIKMLPYYKGFGGDIIETGPRSFRIDGKFQRVSLNQILITEVPVRFDLETYTKHLEKLEEKKIIQDFTDLSTDETFKFEVKVPREFSKNKTDEQIQQIFKLSTNVTENLTCNDENWNIVVHENVDSIMKSFIDIKLRYMQLRKDYLLDQMKDDLYDMSSKYLFIKGVVTGTIDINRKTYDQIAKQLDKIDGIRKVDDSYEYLLRMAISSLTKEKYVQLQEKIKAMKESFKELKGKTIQELWLSDIEELEQALKKAA